MVSIELLDTEPLAKNQADTFYEGNLSEYIRTLIRKDENDKQLIQNRRKGQVNNEILQACTFLFIALALFLLPLNLLIQEFFWMILGICVAGGILLIIQVILMLNKQRMEGNKTWT